MVALRDTRTTWLAYALVLALLAVVAYGGLASQALDTDDFEYLRDANAANQDLSLLFSTDRELPGRPIAEVVFLLGHKLWGQDPTPYHLLLVGLHLLTSLLLAQTFRRLGAHLEISLVGGLLFLLNVAHFRAVQWIACLVYPLALSLALVAILLFMRYLATERRLLLVAAALLQTVAIFAHAGSICAAPFCLYLAWRRYQRPGAAAPLLAVAILIPGLLHFLYPQAPQARETLSIADPIAAFGLFLGYMGRCLDSAHWLVAGQIQPWEMIVGAVVLLGLGWLVVRRTGPEADWGLFALLALMPFVARETVEPSRFFYLSSAGSSLVLAWLLHTGIVSLQHFVGAWFRPLAWGIALSGLVATSLFSLHKAETLAYYSSGRSYHARLQHQQALKSYKKAAALAGNTAATPLPEVYFHLASMQLYFNEDPDPALRQALALFPDYLWLNLVKSLVDQENNNTLIQQRGQDHLVACIEQAKREGRENLLVKNLTSLLHNMGKGYFGQQDYPRAIRTFERVLEINPDKHNTRKALGDTYAELGFQYFEQNRHDLAIEAYQQTLDLNPDDRLARISLGWLFYFQGRWQEAIDQYRLALKHEVDADVQFALGLAYLANRDDKAAQTTYAQGIRLFGVEEAQRIGVLQNLDALIKNSEENIVAREIRMAYWP
ncbi:MAG: tetratricopeptide repeat protein [Gemmatimonadetes bacterium]|nr:tetratricopeptide repeat protein [Gemmatimonadota bacterium]